MIAPKQVITWPILKNHDNEQSWKIYCRCWIAISHSNSSQQRSMRKILGYRWASTRLVISSCRQSILRGWSFLAGGIPTPLKNMRKSVGSIISYYSQYVKNHPNVPNHQPDFDPDWTIFPSSPCQVCQVAGMVHHNPPHAPTSWRTHRLHLQEPVPVIKCWGEPM